MQVIGPEPRIPRRLHGEVRHLVQADIVRVVEEAAARSCEVDEQIGVQHALRPDRRRADCRNVAAKECRLRIFGGRRDLELRPDVLPDADTGLARGEEAGHGFEIDHAGRIDAARIDADLARRVQRPGLAGEHVKAEIGAVDLKTELPHARVEGVGRDRIGSLCRAFEVDFTIAREMRVGADIAFGQNREAALPRRETRFRRVVVLRLRIGNEVVDRAGVGGEIARPVDAGEIDPAAEGQRDILVADLAVGTCRGRSLVGPNRRQRPRLCLDLPFLSSLIVDALFELFQFGLEQLDLRRRIVFRTSLAGGDQQAADKNALEHAHVMPPTREEAFPLHIAPWSGVCVASSWGERLQSMPRYSRGTHHVFLQ